MKKSFKSLFVFLLVLAMAFSLAACGGTSEEPEEESENGESYDFAETGELIISAEDALGMLGEEDTVLVDVREAEDYEGGHVEGAVNVDTNDITVEEDYPNLIAPKETIEDVMGNSGISNDTLVLAYDDSDNMYASRLWWTLMSYGHENTQIVSGGLSALEDAGADMTEEAPEIEEAEFTAEDLNEEYIAYKSDVEQWIEDSAEDVMLIDTRSLEEFNDGTLKGAVHIEYVNNNNEDGTFKSAEEIQELYLDAGLTPEMTAVPFCKTSIRGCNTAAALWNAGYRNIKLYDGAWVEWSDDEDAPTDTPGEMEDAS